MYTSVHSGDNYDNLMACPAGSIYNFRVQVPTYEVCTVYTL